MSEDANDPTSPPVALVRPAASRRWVWLFPVAALLFVVALVMTYVVKHGPVITINMSHGHGIKPTAPVRCRGIVVGEVIDVSVGTSLDEVVVKARLDPSAESIARAGSRFWVVRPRVSITGVGGLDTLAGSHYVEVIPGHGPPQRRFVALDEPPVVAAMDPDGLEIVLDSAERGSLRAGAPITYRQVRVGVVRSVGLAGDASTVQVRGYIEPRFAMLVREDSRFWNVSGAAWEVGLKGVRFELESLQALLDGGIAFATPDPPGGGVRNGQRFRLHARPENRWLRWRPSLPVGTRLLPAGTLRPDLVRITVIRRSGRVIQREQRSKGWLLPVEGGLIGPSDLVPANEEGEIEIDGQTHALADLKPEERKGLVRLMIDHQGSTAWSLDASRMMKNPEDCVVVTDAATAPVLVGAVRLRRSSPAAYEVDDALAFDADLSGAAVMSREDGALVGLLSVDDGKGTILGVEP